MWSPLKKPLDPLVVVFECKNLVIFEVAFAKHGCGEEFNLEHQQGLDETSRHINNIYFSLSSILVSI